MAKVTDFSFSAQKYTILSDAFVHKKADISYINGNLEKYN